MSETVAIANARKVLEDAGYSVQEPPEPAPEHRCAVCGKTDQENRDGFGGGLIDFQVIVHAGEEGASYVTRFFCDEHMQDVGDVLVKLGFGSHHHGSTTFVEADTSECGGYGECTLYTDVDGMEEVY